MMTKNKKGEEEGKRETLRTSQSFFVELSQSELEPSAKDGHNSDWLIFKTNNFSSATELPIMSDKIAVLWWSVFKREHEEILKLPLGAVCD